MNTLIVIGYAVFIVIGTIILVDTYKKDKINFDK
jgi:hypothetical protein